MIDVLPWLFFLFRHQGILPCHLVFPLLLSRGLRLNLLVSAQLPQKLEHKGQNLVCQS